MKKSVLCNQRGVALVIAIVISAALLATALGVLFFIEKSTAMSGVGRAYATADEAADGAVNLMRDTINLTMRGSPLPDVFSDDSNCIKSTIFGAGGGTCAVSLTLPGAVGNFFQSQIVLERLYSVVLPGGRIEFAPSGSSVNSTAVFFRITSQVTGPGGTSAESSVLYRFSW
jgi:hypothetical protein